MSQLTHVFVTVPEGRIVPMPANEMPGAGEQHRCVPGKVYVAPWTRYVRGRIAAGDFNLSNAGGTKVDTAELARARSDLKLEADHTVAKDQRSDDEINKAAADARAEADAKAKALEAAKPKAAEAMNRDARDARKES